MFGSDARGRVDLLVEWGGDNVVERSAAVFDYHAEYQLDYDPAQQRVGLDAIDGRRRPDQLERRVPHQ